MGDNVFLIAIDDGVSSIGTSLIANDNVRPSGQQVDKLSLGFISPLQTNYTYSRQFKSPSNRLVALNHLPVDLFITGANPVVKYPHLPSNCWICLVQQKSCHNLRNPCFPATVNTVENAWKRIFCITFRTTWPPLPSSFVPASGGSGDGKSCGI